MVLCYGFLRGWGMRGGAVAGGGRIGSVEYVRQFCVCPGDVQLPFRSSAISKPAEAKATKQTPSLRQIYLVV